MCSVSLFLCLITQGCDLVVAVTHMRWHNDRRLAEEVPEINLILGGHDHDYQTEVVSGHLAYNLNHCMPTFLSLPQINGIHVIKSGSDFRDFSEITVSFSNIRPEIEVKRHTITSATLPDPEVESLVQRYSVDIQETMKEEIGRLVTSPPTFCTLLGKGHSFISD